MKFLAKIASSIGIQEFLGDWDAEKNLPRLKTGEGKRGGFYRVSKAGSTNIQFINEWQVGDYILFDGVRWHRIPSNKRWKLEHVLLSRKNLTR